MRCYPVYGAGCGQVSISPELCHLFHQERFAASAIGMNRGSGIKNASFFTADYRK